MDQPRKYPYRIYFWMVPNPTTGRMRKTRYRMSEVNALRYPGAVKIEADSLLIDGTLETRISTYRPE